jgi:hypothetical protein
MIVVVEGELCGADDCCRDSVGGANYAEDRWNIPEKEATTP